METMELKTAEKSLEELCGIAVKEFLWVFGNDVGASRGKIFIRYPVPEINKSAMEELLQDSTRRNFPVEIFSFCTLELKLCSSIYVAKNSIDAEYRQINGIKYSCLTSLREAKKASRRGLGSPLAWWILERRGRRLPVLQDLPRRE